MNSIKYICPICGNRLFKVEKSLVCENKHSFDIARQGYINLLPVGQKHSLHPGDDKEMLNARRIFLNSGLYEPIAKSVTDKLQALTADKASPVIVDVGCGEGYYTRKIADSVLGSCCVGVDISKDAARMACSRGKDIDYCVATASHLPFESKSADIITAMFSLVCEDEFARVLRDGGYIVEVTAGTEHLIELKQIIYDEVFPQDKHPAPCGKNFKEVSCENFSYKLEVGGELLKALLVMTPHIRRINPEHRKRLDTLETLNLTISYWLTVKAMLP